MSHCAQLPLLAKTFITWFNVVMYNLSECRMPNDVVNRLISFCLSGLFLFLVMVLTKGEPDAREINLPQQFVWLTGRLI